MLDVSVKNRLNEMCCDHGFKRRGQAYFRIHAEEILQVIKFEYERVFSHYSLNFGLVSMYSELRDDAFTSQTYLDRYPICNLDNCVTNIISYTIDGTKVITIRSPENQLALLENKGYAWLDSVTTHQRLSEAITELDVIRFKEVHWNDFYKIYPFLVSEDYESADYILAAIFNQHLGPCSPALPPWEEKYYIQYATQYKRPHYDLLSIHQMIADKNYDAIKAYLKQNYQNNMDRLRFLNR